MVWTPEQRVRLAIEKEKLEQYFLLGVTWIDPQHETKVEVLLKSNSDKEYKLRIYIPADFPNSCPVLVVVQPKILLLKNGSRLPERSYTFHTLPDTHGHHRICHFYPPDWTPDITLYQVFMKGRLWIEGYEAHLRTGKDMDAFLGEQKYTPQPRNTAQNIQRERLTAPRPVVQQVSNSPLQTIVRSSCRNTSSAHYGNLSEEPVSRYSHSEREFLGARYVNDPVNNPRMQRRATYSDPASNSRTNNLNPARSNSLGSYISPLPTARCDDESIVTVTGNSAESQTRNTYSNPTTSSRSNNPVRSNSLNSNIPLLPTARYANEPVQNPTANSRRGNNLNSARSNSLSMFISPLAPARYDDEPLDTYLPHHMERKELNITAQDEESQFFNPVHDMTTPLPNLSRQNSSSTVPVGSVQELPRYNVSNEGSACDANNNEETASQNYPASTPSRYRPAGAVPILLPFRDQNAPILRRVPPKAKPKPKPRR